jgi:hypothetical protein
MKAIAAEFSDGSCEVHGSIEEGNENRALLVD